ncbi:MAG: helix-hairpin-helix domain-containing protein [Nanoarchaeota archaeon]|nr:helix-hairpin-helix domain-containing protein [Nanoarchaeota archaeon]
MNTFEKAKILSNSGKYDSCGPKMCEVNVKEGLGGIYYAKAEHKTCRLFKTLMDNRCSFDCKYCGNSKDCANKGKTASYEPDELAKLFMQLHEKLDVFGLFLSLGIAGDADTVTEKMIESVRLLREKYHFKQYIHFKVLPGTSYELVKRASIYSDRMSINLEAPNKGVLSELSSCKDYKIDILRRQSWVSKLNLSAGQTTQLILNNMSTDKDVLKMVDWEYSNMKLKRVYYSAFRPVKGTPLENDKAEPLSRQNHLYNVDFLNRVYGFGMKEFDTIMDNGMLPKEDPKLALAKKTFDGPVDINEASYEELIRIPGIGPKTAGKITKERYLSGRIRKYEQLYKLGASIEKAKQFIEVDGKRQMMLSEF